MMGIARFTVAGVMSFIALSILSCESPESPDLTKSTSLVIPRISGIYFAFNYEPWGKWGDPDGLPFLYRNPSIPPTGIKHSLRDPGHVRIWVVRALGPDDPTDSISVIMGGDVISALGIPIKILRDSVYNHTVNIYTIWDGTDKDGNDMPAGFYRIYVQADNELFWYDYLLYRENGDIPPDLWP